jgi:hypothetical protein
VKFNLSWLRSGKPNFQLFFAFECAILTCKCLGAAAKYCLAVVDAALHHRWPSKGLYVLYIELFVDVIHFFLYATFFVSVLHVYRAVPYHLLFDVYSAYRTVFQAATNYLRFRTVMSRIGSLTVATAEDIERVGGTCIICRDDMVSSEALKKLGCGHVFHLSCLQSWLERQQTCPICRSDIFETRPSPTPATAAAEAPEAVEATPATGAVEAGAPHEAPQSVHPPSHAPGPTETAQGGVTPGVASARPLQEAVIAGGPPGPAENARGVAIEAGTSGAGAEMSGGQQPAHLPYTPGLPQALLVQVGCCKLVVLWCTTPKSVLRSVWPQVS